MGRLTLLGFILEYWKPVPVYNVTTEKRERVSRLVEMHANERTEPSRLMQATLLHLSA